MNVYFLSLISVLLIISFHILILNIEVNNVDNFQNKLENQDQDMESELNKYINSKNICSDEFDESIYENNKMYELDDVNEFIQPYNKLSKNNKSKFCSDEKVGDKYYESNKNILTNFMNKLFNKKCVKSTKLDEQTYEPIYKDDENTVVTKDKIKYGDEKLLNGGEFYNGIYGYTDNDLNDVYASYDSI